MLRIDWLGRGGLLSRYRLLFVWGLMVWIAGSLPTLAQEGPSLRTKPEPLFVTGCPAGSAFLERWLGVGEARELRPGESLTDRAGKLWSNWEVPRLAAELLCFSDHPERVTAPGQLFSGGLLPMKAVRLQYYHQGGYAQGLQVITLLENKGQQPALVHLIQGMGGPSVEYHHAGHDNNVEFLRALVRGEGWAVAIAPGEKVVVAQQALPLEQVVSATQQMALLQGSQVEYGVFAVTALDQVLGYALQSRASDVHARGFYAIADELVTRRWQVGDPQAYIAIGAVRQPNLFLGPALKGDYGVVYCLDLALVNPTEQEAVVELQFNPRGGHATAGFLGLIGPETGHTFSAAAASDGAAGISGNGDIKGEGEQVMWNEWFIPELCEAFTETTIATVELAPHSQRRVQLLSIPEGASNYPIRVKIIKAS